MAAERPPTDRFGNELTGTFGDEEEEGRPTKADIARMKAQAKADPANMNPARTSATGRAPQPRPPSTRTPTRKGHRPLTRRPIGRRASNGRPLRPRLGNPTGGRSLSEVAGSAGTSGAGLVLGMVAYALVLSVVKYGPSGPLLWFRAKFLNEPAGSGGGAANTAPSHPAPPAAAAPATGPVQGGRQPLGGGNAITRVPSFTYVPQG